MPLLPHDPSLERIRVRAGLQHVLVMVRLDQQHIQVPQMVHRVAVEAPHIRGDSAGTAFRFDPVGNRIRRVMTDVKCFRLHITNHKRLVRVNRAKQFLIYLSKGSIPQNLPDRGLRRIDRNMRFPEQDAQSRDMIAVLMRDKNCRQILHTPVDIAQRVRDPFTGDSCIDQNR